jgi:hypothetical protein
MNTLADFSPDFTITAVCWRCERSSELDLSQATSRTTDPDATLQGSLWGLWRADRGHSNLLRREYWVRVPAGVIMVPVSPDCPTTRAVHGGLKQVTQGHHARPGAGDLWDGGEIERKQPPITQWGNFGSIMLRQPPPYPILTSLQTPE